MAKKKKIETLNAAQFIATTKAMSELAAKSLRKKSDKAKAKTMQPTAPEALEFIARFANDFNAAIATAIEAKDAAKEAEDDAASKGEAKVIASKPKGLIAEAKLIKVAAAMMKRARSLSGFAPLFVPHIKKTK